MIPSGGGLPLAVPALSCPKQPSAYPLSVSHSRRGADACSLVRTQLLVWVFGHRDAQLIERMYTQLPASLRANTVLLVTRCDGGSWIH